MTNFSATGTSGSLTVKLWRGESMCLIAMDVAPKPADTFAGFAIEVRSPNSDTFYALRNRLAFAYPAAKSVDGSRQFPTTEAPIQRFRWVHFPKQLNYGTYTYRVTMMHMQEDGSLKPGDSVTLDILLDAKAYPQIEVAFTRNFASSQAYAERFRNRADILPQTADEGLDFQKPEGSKELYEWLGFEGAAAIFAFLDSAVADPTVTLDVCAYDLNEGDIVGRLEKLGSRLRIIIDDSPKDHDQSTSAESQAATRLAASGAQVKRTHFQGLQHHKVLIASRNGAPFKVITGSTNFSYRGLYIQANNAVVFEVPEVAALYQQMFDLSWQDPDHFNATDFAKTWHVVEKPGLPRLHFCFSPHGSKTDFALSPASAAVDQATSSVFYSIAFLGQMKSGAVYKSITGLADRPIFSYGVADKRGKLEVGKPDGSIGLVDFEFLAKNAPPPFKAEWSAGKGINIHNKFIVTDFNLPSAKVFTGSSNLSPSGEAGNGDHMVVIEDQRIATAYAIQAILLFDHLHFRSAMQAQKKASTGTPAAHAEMTLAKPTGAGGTYNWFDAYYDPKNAQKVRDRLTFAH